MAPISDGDPYCTMLGTGSRMPGDRISYGTGSLVLGSLVLGELQVTDAVVVERAVGSVPGGRREVLAEQPRSRAAGERINEQVQLVDQAVGQQGPDERPAAADVQA